jgi:poly-gamma-glutamate system protein
MADGIRVVAEHCRAEGIGVDPATDLNGSCLVGPEVSPLFTTLGDPAAKRTTTNPDMAALLVHLLREGGVGPGDRVAVGASGSFPALLLATLVAAEALQARPVVLLSLGASSYGATRPEFHLLDLHRLLLERGIVTTPPAGVSLGGTGDVGGEFEPSFREALRAELQGAGVPVLADSVLRDGVLRRLAIYGLGEQGGAPARPLAAFVNIGGSDANLGTSPRALEVPTGLTRKLAEAVRLPAPEERGVLFEMAARGVPVIHLLNLRGLALRHGLSWDPVPLPPPGSTRLRTGEEEGGWAFWILTVAYLAALALVATWGWIQRGRTGGS